MAGNPQAIAFAQHIMIAGILSELAGSAPDRAAYLEKIKAEFRRGLDVMPIRIDGMSEEQKTALREDAKLVTDMVVGMIGK